MASRATPVYAVDGLQATVRAKKPFTFGVKGTVDGEPEATRGHKLDVSFPSGPRAVLPVKVKDNLKVKGAWIIEALLPGDGDYVMVVKVDGKEITGSPFNVKADSNLGSSNPAPAASASTNILSSSAAFDTPAAAGLSSSPALSASPQASMALTRDIDKQPERHSPLADEPTVVRPSSAASSPAPSLAIATGPVLRAGGPRDRKVTWSVVGIEEKISTRLEAGRPVRFQLHCRDQNGIWAPSTAKIEPKFTGPRAIFPSLAAAHPGVWVIEWAATIAGEYTLVVNVDGQQVAGPFSLPVQAPELTREQILEADNKRLAAPAPEPENPLRPKITDEMVNTTLDALKQTEETKRIWHMFGEGRKGATSGKMARFEMHAKDQYGTFIPLPTLHYLRVDFEGPAPIFPSRHEHQSIRGIYVIECASKLESSLTNIRRYKPVAAGTYTMHIKVDGEPIEGSPFSIVVAEGERAQGIYYEASGPGVEGATSGVAAKFQVQARDQDGLPAASAAVLRVKFEGPRPVFPHVQRKEDKKGFYVVEYCASKAGSYQMFVTADDQPIEGSPFAVTVAQGGRAEVSSSNPISSSDPASASSSSSSIHSSAGGDSKSAEPARGPTVDRGRCDVTGMVVESHVGRALTFSILARSRHVEPVTGAKFDVSITEIKSGTVIPFICAEGSNGSHHVNYTPTVPGAYRINIDFEGAPIPKSPFRVAIKDKPSALKSPMSRPSFFLQARTFAGDALADGGDEVVFTVEGPEAVQTNVKDMGSGSYVLSYNQPNVAGFYVFNVKLNGEHVQNSPWTVALGSVMSAAPMTEEEKQRVAEEAQKREEKRLAEEEVRQRREEDERKMREEVARAKAIEEEERKKREAAEAEAKRKAILQSGESAAQSEVIVALKEELAAERKEKETLLAKIAALEQAEVDRKTKEEAAKQASAEAERKAREAAEKKAKEKQEKKAKEEADRLEREAALAEKARVAQANAEAEQNREVVKGDMSNTKTAAFFKKEAQEAAAMLRARRQKEMEDKQRETEEKAKRDAEAEEKAKQEAANAPPPAAAAEPKQSIKDRGAALNLRIGALIPGSAPPPRPQVEEVPAESSASAPSSDSTSPAVPATASTPAVEEKFATKSRPAGAATRRKPSRPRRGTAPAAAGAEKKEGEEDDQGEEDGEENPEEAKAEAKEGEEKKEDQPAEPAAEKKDEKPAEETEKEDTPAEQKKEEPAKEKSEAKPAEDVPAASATEQKEVKPAEATGEKAEEKPAAAEEKKDDKETEEKKEEKSAEDKKAEQPETKPAEEKPAELGTKEEKPAAEKEERPNETKAEDKPEERKDDKPTEEKKEQVGRAKISLSALRSKTSTTLTKEEKKEDAEK